MKRKCEKTMTDYSEVEKENGEGVACPSGKRRKRVLEESKETNCENMGDWLQEMGVSPLADLKTEAKKKPHCDREKFVLRSSFSLGGEEENCKKEEEGEEEEEEEDFNEKLCDDLALRVFRWLDKQTLAKCALVCRKWRRLCEDESLWKRLDLGGKSLDVPILETLMKRGLLVLRLAKATLLPSLSSSSSLHSFRVQYLDLSMAILEPSLLATLFKSTGKLKKISLEQCDINDSVCKELSKNKELSVLHLSMARGLTLRGLETLLDSLLYLEELNVSWTEMKSSSIDVLTKKCPLKLKRLNMAGCKDHLTDQHLDNLAEIAVNLKELDLSDAGSVSARVIESIVIHLRRLENLAVSRCYNIPPNSYLMLASSPSLLYLTVHGVMKEGAIKELKAQLPRIQINKHIFSTVARPTVGIRKTSIWNLRVRD